MNLYKMDLPVASAIAMLAGIADSAVKAEIAKLSAPCDEALDVAVRVAMIGNPSWSNWYQHSEKCWHPEDREMEVLWGLRGTAERAINGALLAIRGKDGIGETPVGANPDGVVWLYEILADAAMDAVSAAYGDTRPGVRPMDRVAEAARAVDAIATYGLMPARTHDAAVAEFRRVGLEHLARMADGATGYAPV